jgi:integrase
VPSVTLKGINRVRTKLASGKVVVYWYAWKGGPRLPGRPGDPEFIAAFNEAIAQLRTPSKDTLASLVARYKASPEFVRLTDSTKAEWSRWLDRISADTTDRDIGGLTFRILDDRRVRADLLEWRDQWADRPRSADYAIQVLSRVLAWGLDRGLLRINAITGVEQLYRSDRADQIWTPDEIERFCKVASIQVGQALRLACLTGLRRGDLVKLSWSHVGDLTIAKPTAKSRHAKTTFIPLLDETRTLLTEIRAARAALEEERAAKKKPPLPASIAVLTNSRGKPWTGDGLETQVIKAKTASGVDKHLHDARGAFATRLRVAGLTRDEIAQIMAWEPARVDRLLAVYVEQEAVVRAMVNRIQGPTSP